VGSAKITDEELRDSIHELLQAEGDLAVVRVGPQEQNSVFQALWQKLAALGWLGLAIEERYGGLGLGVREASILYQALGRYLTPLPVMPTLLAAESVAAAGNEKQRSQWLPPLASGAIRATLALPAGHLVLPTLRDDGSVNGSVANVLYADRVDQLVLPVRSTDGAVELAIVPSVDARVLIEPRPVIDLTRTLCDVHLVDFQMTADRLLPLTEHSWNALLDHASVALACDAVGGAMHILERTVAYMRTRVQFDRPIGSFQALKHRAATWKILLESVGALTGHAVELVARADGSRSAIASCAKFSACDAYVAVAGDAVQLHGGIGFTWEHECHLFLKRAQLGAALFGCSTQHKERAAEFAFGEALGKPNTGRRLLTTSADRAKSRSA
jgi:alkylation response protein AidB-like acyl-CoA dehydrogenase